MRILHVITTLDPSHGGPPLVASRLGAAQAALGHEVTVLSYAKDGARERIEKDLATLPGAGLLKIESLPPPSRSERFTAAGAKLRLREVVRRKDVVHLHGIWEPILRGAATEAGAAGVPYVVAPHGMLDAWALSEKRLKKRIALALGYGRMVRGAAFVHALSAHERECVLAGRFNERAAVIPNGVNIGELEPLPEAGAFARQHPELRGTRYALFLARLHPVKGLDILAEATASLRDRFPDFRLVVAGPDFGAEGALRAQLRTLGVEDRVLIPGPVYGADKRAILAGATLFALPSKHEGFSMSIAEALACRVPVVISEECFFPEVGEAGAGRVVKRDAASVAVAIAEILENPARGRAMGEAGRRLIEERFTWPRVAERSIRAYETRA